MATDCSPTTLTFQRHRSRRVEADFDGGMITTHGGALLLREVEMRRSILARLAGCFTDGRDPGMIEFSKEELVAQRVYGLALGYEDVDDHDSLRHDSLLAMLVGRADVTGKERRHASDRGVPLASSSTLHRLEHSADGTTKTRRHYKFSYDPAAMDRLLVDLFIESYDAPPEEVVLDLDATDDPVHGKQEGRFFHGYYGHYCYLPLYIFCGDFPLCARLRRANIDACDGCIEELDAIIEQLREHWPKTRIVIRGDSGFARETILAWCEEMGLDYVIGMARNSRLEGMLEADFEELRRTGERKTFRDLDYRTVNTWSRSRRVVGKAEILGDKDNPRFVVTSLSADEVDAESLYCDRYCARGDMENRIKEQQLDLFADRTSTSLMGANQLRLYFSTFAYVLLSELRRLGLAGTDLARAYVGTIRNRLLRVGARVYVSVRRVLCRFTSAFVDKDTFRAAWAALRAPPTTA